MSRPSRRNIMKSFAGSIVAVGAFAAASACDADAAASSAPDFDLLGRVDAPSDESLAVFHEAGMLRARVHTLTAVEKDRLASAAARLPIAYRAALRDHLSRLSFVDGVAGAGNALTRKLTPDGAPARFEMTLRSEVLSDSLTALLTRKEQICFAPDGSGTSVQIDAGRIDALTYVLLHEATHVLEGGAGENGIPWASVSPGVWLDLHRLAPALEPLLACRTAYRRLPALPFRQAGEVYRGLLQTPFVSLYATASRSEDLAETAAWAILRREFGDTLVISVDHGADGSSERFRPLTNPSVVRRFDAIEAMLRLRNAPPAA